MISETLLHLSLISGVDTVTVKKLFEILSEQGANLYDFTAADFCAVGCPSEFSNIIVDGLRDRELLEKTLCLFQQENVNWSTLADDTYPALLWHIHQPPPVLYWQGRPVWNEGPTLAVVGARKGDSYGRRAIETILGPCIDQGMVIVSGGALGIDAMAHDFTVSCHGATVVVLGSGILRHYPSSNKQLFRDVIASGGAVVSCFPPTVEAIPWQFPARNRIIAGMSRGCLVIQAGEGSGALITAKYALNEGRNVYAIPGQFDDPLSFGCHQLLQEGAQMVTSADHILSDYQLEKYASEKQDTLFDLIKKERPREAVRQERVNQQSVVEQNEGILAFCARPVSMHELVEKTGKPEHELKLELFELQLAGKVEQDFVGLWCRVR